MNNPENPETALGEKELMTAMFASLVMQQTNMASIFLGLAPHPQTGQVARDLEHAKYFIDQLEMLAVKTRGNLDKQEEGLLKHSLTSLRLAFVEAVSKPAETAPGVGAGSQSEKSAGQTTGSAAPSLEPETSNPPDRLKPGLHTPESPAPEPEKIIPATPPVEDSRKKFSKKY